MYNPWERHAFMSADGYNSSTAYLEACEYYDVSSEEDCPRVWGDAGIVALNADMLWTFPGY